MNSFRNLCRISFFPFIVGCCTGLVGNDTAVTPPIEQRQSVDAGALRDARIERLKQTTVALVHEIDGVMIAVCAGIWIDQNLILTANHCTEDEPLTLKYSAQDDYDIDRSRTALLIASDEASDLALLFADPDTVPTHPIVSLTNGAINPGDELHIIGHTSGFTWTYAKGYVSSTRVQMRGPGGNYFPKILQISAPVWMGNSGGGAFDENGDLVGISSWISASGPNLAFFVHRDVIREFIMKQAEKKM